MKAAIQGAFVFLLLILAGIGGYSLGRMHGEGVTPAPDDGKAADSPDVAALRAENQRLRQENLALARRSEAPPDAPSQVPAVPTGPMAAPADNWPQLRYLAAAQKEKLANIRVPITGFDGRLSPQFVKLFSLSDVEQQALQSAFDRTHAQIRELASAYTTVKREGDALVLSMPPFEGGADLYDQFMDSVTQILGSERNAAFVLLQDSQISSMFSGFGAERRVITVAREASSGGRPVISIRDERQAANGRTISSSTVHDAATVAQRFPALAPYLDQVSQLPLRPARPRGRTMEAPR